MADFSGLGYGGVTYENSWYNLLNVNLHAESEHTFSGVHKPMELHMVAESGRLGRAELLAKRPHGRLRRLSAELQNVGEALGKLRPFNTF